MSAIYETGTPASHGEGAGSGAAGTGMVAGSATDPETLAAVLEGGSTTSASPLARILDGLKYSDDEVLSTLTGLQRPSGRQATVAELRTWDLSGRNVWIGLMPMRKVASGRGTVADVLRVPAIFADLDVGEGKLPDLETCQAVIDTLSGMIGAEPLYVTFSGHGLQPVWATEDDDVDLWRELTPQWGRLVALVAEKHGGRVDNVFELARVLRVPGSVNYKDPDAPVLATLDWRGGSPIDPKALADVVDTHLGPEEEASDPAQKAAGCTADILLEAVRDGSLSPLAVLPDGWEVVGTTGARTWIRRPGAESDQSGNVRDGIFVIHSGAVDWAERRRDGRAAPKPPAKVLAESRFGGDFGAAMRWVESVAAATVVDGEAPPDDWPAEVLEAIHGARPNVEDGYGHSNLTDGQLRSVALGRRMARDWRRRYIYVPQMGWHRWDGCRWKRVDDKHLNAEAATWAEEFIIGLIRDGVPRSVIDVALKYRDVNQVAALVRGAATAPALLVDVDQLDIHPHLLNCPNGIVDLRDGTLRPSDPSLYLTKVTSVPYAPGYRHPDWDKALESLDAEPRGFLQRRLGQALYGQAPTSDELLLCHGGGENGKTTVLSAAYKAIDDYAVMVPEEALIGAADQHPTVFMVFRGARLALLEETPEARHINTVRLKRVVGQPTMTGRLIGKDFVTFPITHTMFIATNYLPTVDETDHGTWRRLLRLDFPYRFCDNPQRANEKRGEEGLRERVLAPGSGGLRAALAWMVAGAVAHHQDGEVFPSPPRQVVEATKDWRRQADTTWAFIEENLEFNAGSCVLTQELYDHFCDWMKARGMRYGNIRTFTTRFGSHPLVTEAGVVKEETRELEGLSRRHRAFAAAAPARATAWLGVRFRSSGEGGEGPSGGFSRGGS